MANKRKEVKVVKSQENNENISRVELNYSIDGEISIIS